MRHLFLAIIVSILAMSSSSGQCGIELNSATTIGISCLADEGAITIDSITGPGRPYTFELDGVSNGNDSTFSNVKLGNHTLVIKNSSSCSQTYTISVVKGQCPEIVPNELISPNGDGTNDTWGILGIDLYENNHVRIFNRWGQRVYSKKGYKNAEGWDGTYLGKLLPHATYYYVITTGVKGPDGNEVKVQGAITLIQ